MKSIKCNIIKAGRGDVYGRPFAIGQIYTGPFDYVRQLVSCGYATVDDAAVFDDDSTPQNSEIAIVGKGRMAVEAELNEVTGGIEISAGGKRIDALTGGIDYLPVPDRKACDCGAILRGEKRPEQCSIFATACTPEHPVGACMVSAEGACAAHYSYVRFRQGTQARGGMEG